MVVCARQSPNLFRTGWPTRSRNIRNGTPQSLFGQQESVVSTLLGILTFRRRAYPNHLRFH